MKKYIFLGLAVCMHISLLGQNKQALKKLEKKYNAYSQGSIYAKNDQVAILGANLRFRLASRQVGETSWKDESWRRFAAYAMLNGIGENVFQEITDEYNQMLIKKFEALGLSVVDYESLKGAKSFNKLREKGLRDRENVKKSWGVAQIYSPSGQEYITWNNAAPFGPQQKIPKELRAILFNSLVTIDFCHIGVDVSQTGTTYHGLNERVIYTEGKSSVVPVINIDGYTYSSQGAGMLEDNTYMFSLDPSGKQFNLKLDLTPSEIESDIGYAENTEKCENCEPAFAKSFVKLMENGMGTVVITADPDKYKEAVLDALQKYLDEVFTLYESQKK